MSPRPPIAPRPSSRRTAPLVAALAVVALAWPARAQRVSPYSTTVYNEGPGIRLGHAPLVLHPGFAADIGYDSNVFYQASSPVGAGLLRLRVHLDLATLPPQVFENDQSTADPKIDFRFSTQVEYREYLTRDPEVQAQRSVNVQAGVDVGILPKGPFTLRMSDTLVRTVDPRNAEGPGTFARVFNRAGLMASWKRGPLEIGVGDHFQLNWWEQADVRFGNNLSNEAQAYGRLRILSQTLLSLVGRFGWIRYTNNAALEAYPVRAMLGASTLFTTWLGASASVGYGNSLHRQGPRFNHVVAAADVRFLLPFQIRITLGYDRDFYDSIFASFYVDDHAFLQYEQPFLKRLAVRVGGGVRVRKYEGLVDLTQFGGSVNGSNERRDLIFDAHGELIVRATDWLTCGASYNLLGNDTDFIFLTPAPTPVKYTKHAVFARLDIAY